MSAAWGWKTPGAATVVRAPEPIRTLKGPEFYYWVQFDEPRQAIDGDGAC